MDVNALLAAEYCALSVPKKNARFPHRNGGLGLFAQDILEMEKLKAELPYPRIQEPGRPEPDVEDIWKGNQICYHSHVHHLGGTYPT